MIKYFSDIFTAVSTIAGGMFITLNHLLNARKGIATLQYPEEKWPRPERNIGFDHESYNVIRSRLHVDMDDCIGCLKCERVCPDDCIKIETVKAPDRGDDIKDVKPFYRYFSQIITVLILLSLEPSSFINNGGMFVRKKIENIIPRETSVSLNYINNHYTFDKVVLCAGSWSNILTKKFGESFPLGTERGYNVMFDNIDLISRPIGWSHSGFYLVQLQDGLRAAGTVEIAGLEKPANIKRTKMIEAQARKILPQLKEVQSTWLGFRPTLPDSMPIIGESQINKNIIYGFGHQHIGWTLGAVTGKIINTLCCNRKPNFNIESFVNHLLTYTCPASNLLAVHEAFFKSFVKTPAPNPKSVSLAISIASSCSSYSKTDKTGPNISSRATVISCFTLFNTVASIK